MRVCKFNPPISVLINDFSANDCHLHLHLLIQHDHISVAARGVTALHQVASANGENLGIVRFRPASEYEDDGIFAVSGVAIGTAELQTVHAGQANIGDDDELRAGHQMQEFVVERLLGVGGYSVVYLARDTKLDRRVALKEYLPATLAMRAPDGSVMARLPHFEGFYRKGLEGFLNEARLLGSFDHPSLLKVFRFWPENADANLWNDKARLRVVI